MVSSAISEDFSFPKMNNPPPHFAFTPSLWRVPSEVLPDFCDNDDDGGEDELDHFANKSSSACSASDDGQVMISIHDEEKMDLLWEDFNEEEIQRVCDSMVNNKYKSQNSDDLHSESSTSGGHVKQQVWCVKKKGSPFRIFSCVKTEFKISRNRMISSTDHDQPKIRPTSVVVVFRVLKSIFWLRRSSSDQMN